MKKTDAQQRQTCGQTTSKKNHYLTLTCHFVNKQWEVESRVLFTCQFPDEKKSGENIERELVKQLKKFLNMDINIENLHFVTDQGTNMLAALRNYKRIDCAAHLLNTVLRNVLKNINSETLLDTLTATKSLVTFLKQSGLSGKLPRTVHQQVDTRWSSLFGMIDSVLSQMEEIRLLLEERDQQFRLEQISIPDLQLLLNFVEPFHEATKELQGDGATLHLVILWYRKLLHLLEEQPNVVKEVAINHLKLKFERSLQKCHKIAIFLHPLYRQLKMFPEEERQEILALMEYELGHIRLSVKECSKAASPPMKKGKFGEWEEETLPYPSTENSPTVSEELSRYVHC